MVKLRTNLGLYEADNPIFPKARYIHLHISLRFVKNLIHVHGLVIIVEIIKEWLRGVSLSSHSNTAITAPLLQSGCIDAIRNKVDIPAGRCCNTCYDAQDQPAAILVEGLNQRTTN